MAYLLLTLAAIFWGGNYTVGALMVTNVNPVLLAEGRWLLTSVVLLSINYKSLVKNFPEIRKTPYSVTVLAICGQVLFPLTLYIGLQYTTPLNAAIYLSATPGLVLVINHFVFRDYINIYNITGVVISTIGVYWLVTHGHLSHVSYLNGLNIGDFWVMLSAISWAIYSAFLRIKPKHIAGNAFVTFSALVGALVLLPVSAAVFAYTPTAAIKFVVDTKTIIGLVYLVIFPSWLAYLFWGKGIAAIGATRGEIFTHLVPLSAGLFSILFLNLKLHQYHVISLLMIGAGVYLCSKHGHSAIRQES